MPGVDGDYMVQAGRPFALVGERTTVPYKIISFPHTLPVGEEWGTGMDTRLHGYDGSFVREYGL